MYRISGSGQISSHFSLSSYGSRSQQSRKRIIFTYLSFLQLLSSQLTPLLHPGFEPGRHMLKYETRDSTHAAVWVSKSSKFFAHIVTCICCKFGRRRLIRSRITLKNRHSGQVDSAGDDVICYKYWWAKIITCVQVLFSVASVCLSECVCPHKVWKTTDQKLM